MLDFGFHPEHPALGKRAKSWVSRYAPREPVDRVHGTHVAGLAGRGTDRITLDLGDHMYVCNGDLSIANAQMNLYMAATKQFNATWFMTTGNHE